MSDWKSRNSVRLREEPWYLRRPGLAGWLLAGLMVVIILWAVKAYASNGP